MVANVKDKAVIVGAYNTKFAKESGVSELNLAAQAVKGAIDDAGLKATDIDGFATFAMDSNDEIEVARAVGTGELTFWGRSHYGGGAARAGQQHQDHAEPSAGGAASADFVGCHGCRQRCCKRRIRKGTIHAIGQWVLPLW